MHQLVLLLGGLRLAAGAACKCSEYSWSLGGCFADGVDVSPRCGCGAGAWGPWNAYDGDSLVNIFSSGKSLEAIAVAMLVSRGLVDYDAPVAEYWPEFAAAGKDSITVRQVMCHEAGLYDVRGMIDHARRMLDWAYMTEVLAAARPAHEPGATHGLFG